MFIIKVGEFYVQDVVVAFGGFMSNITLSKEMSKGFTKAGAERIAKMINGTVISMGDVDTFCEEASND